MISHAMKSPKLGKLIFGRYDKSPSRFRPHRTRSLINPFHPTGSFFTPKLIILIYKIMHYFSFFILISKC